MSRHVAINRSDSEDMDTWLSNNRVKRWNEKKLLEIDSSWHEKVHIIDPFIGVFYAILSSCPIGVFLSPRRTLGHKFLFIEVFWASCDINFVMPTIAH